MRIDPFGYAIINQQDNRSPRYVVKIEFAGAPAYDYYITSHTDAALPPGIIAADVAVNMLEDLSGTTQKIDPIKAVSTIGSMSFNVIDKNETITNKIKEQYGDITGPVTPAEKGLRGKVVEFYIGEENLAWDDYILIQTQIVRSVSLKDGTYTFKCSDIQRTIRETVFDPHITYLTENISATQTFIPAIDPALYQTLVHDSSYTVEASQTVGYIEIQEEVIAWPDKLSIAEINTASDVSFNASTITSTTIDLSQYLVGMYVIVSGGGANDGVGFYVTASSANTLTASISFTTVGATAASLTAERQFYNCLRGRLNTKAVSHIMSDPLPAEDKREKITEIIYLEAPIPKLAYMILTGSIYGTLSSLPDNWHLGVSVTFVATSEFVNIGTDFWDVTDPAAGQRAIFEAPKKTTGKKFIESELCLLGGFYMPVLSDGQLGFRRMVSVLSDASPISVLDETNILSIGALNHNMEEVHNQFNINWNYDRHDKRFTRGFSVIDGDSVTRHGTADALTLNFQGLHGSSATTSTLVSHVDNLRDRYAGPPQEISVNCMFNRNVLEVGDIVLLRLNDLQDFVAGGSINRSFEVQEVKTNWRTGTVTLALFGSSQAAESIAQTTLATALDPAYYTSEGTDISVLLAANGTENAGKFTLTTDATLTGSSDTRALASIYYYDGDFEISSGVTLTIHNNIQLRVNGDTTINGTVDGSLNGNTAPVVATPSTADYFSKSVGVSGIGNTQPAGSILLYQFGGWGLSYRIGSSNAPTTKGKLDSVPYRALRNVGTQLLGIVEDLRGTTGAQGGPAVFQWPDKNKHQITSNGGRGGNGGAGLIIVSKNIFGGSGGKIALNGGDGQKPSITGLAVTNKTAPSYGSGGCPGGCVMIIDGNGSAADTIVEQLYGTSYTDYPRVDNDWYQMMHWQWWTSFYAGTTHDNTTNRNAFTRVQKLAPQETAEIDSPSETTVGSVMTLQEVPAVNTTLNYTAIEVSVSAPIGSGPAIDNYAGSHIYARKTVDDSWFDVGEVGPIGELAILVPADGSTWEVKAHPVSVTGVMSNDYISDNITITATLETVIGTGNAIVTNTGVELVGGVLMDEDGIAAYDGLGNIKVSIDGNTGLITASDVTLSGNITATTGAIGGWDITAGAITSPNDRITLDSSSNRIQVESATGLDYVRINADGITGVDNVLGTTFRLPTDGTPPSFSSGIIKSTVFEITTAGILETSATVGNGGPAGQGVRINDVGITGFKINDPNPVFQLDSTDGSLTALDANITGTITIGAGSSGVGNLTDSGDLATQDRVDLNYVDGADQTSINTAANITSQGALATLNSAAWQTQVTGTGKPLDYADKTNTILQTGTTITGGGIVLSNGGAIRSFSKLSYTSIAAGFWIGYEAGKYKLNVGGNTSYFKWNGDALEMYAGLTTKGMRINVNGDNRFVIHGNRGDGTTADLVELGPVLAGDAVAQFGGTNVGYTRIGLLGMSYNSIGVSGTSTTSIGVNGTSGGANPGVKGNSSSGSGVSGVSTSGLGVEGFSGAVTGVKGSTTSGVGVEGFTTSGHGMKASSNTTTGLGNLYLVPHSDRLPVHTAAKGTIWIRGNNLCSRYINQNGATQWVSF